MNYPDDHSVWYSSNAVYKAIVRKNEDSLRDEFVEWIPHRYDAGCYCIKCREMDIIANQIKHLRVKFKVLRENKLRYKNIHKDLKPFLVFSPIQYFYESTPISELMTERLPSNHVSKFGRKS